MIGKFGRHSTVLLQTIPICAAALGFPETLSFWNVS